MHGEERGGHGTAEGRARGALQQEKKQDDIQGMEQDIGQVVTGGVQAEKLDVSHMREPSEGMPIGFGEGGKGPGDAGASETLLHLIVIGDVGGIVIADEGAAQGVGVEGQGEQCKAYGEQEGGVSLRPGLRGGSGSGRKIELGRSRERGHFFTNS